MIAIITNTSPFSCLVLYHHDVVSGVQSLCHQADDPAFSCTVSKHKWVSSFSLRGSTAPPPKVIWRKTSNQEKRRQQYETKSFEREQNRAGGRSTRPEEEGVSIMVHKKKVDEEYMSRRLDKLVWSGS
jgi:hypothetical protein